MTCEEVCAFCRHWKAGTTDIGARKVAYDWFLSHECHVKQPQETRADETCSMWKEVGKA